MANAPRSYEDFKPSSKWVRGDTFDAYLINLQGFKREQLKIHLLEWRILRVTGERPVGGNRWRRFQEEVPIPEGCYSRKIHAKLLDGVLQVLMPKAAAIPSDEDSSSSSSTPWTTTTDDDDTEDSHDYYYSDDSEGKRKRDMRRRRSKKNKKRALMAAREALKMANGDETMTVIEDDTEAKRRAEVKSVAVVVAEDDADKKMERKEEERKRDEPRGEGMWIFVEEPKGGDNLHQKRGWGLKLNQSRKLMANAAALVVAVAVAMATSAGIYVSYRFRT